jgi:hypothetical protein
VEDFCVPDASSENELKKIAPILFDEPASQVREGGWVKVEIWDRNLRSLRI